MLMLAFLLALLWLLLTGEFTVLNFAVGLMAAGGLLWLMRRSMPADVSAQRPGVGSILRRAGAFVGFSLFFIWSLIEANVRVAIDVLRPRPRMEPAVVAVPLDGFSDAEVTLLANFITLTPGTLSLDVVPQTPDAPRTLYVHAMHAGRTQTALDGLCTQIRATIGRRVQEVI